MCRPREPCVTAQVPCCVHVACCMPHGTLHATCCASWRKKGSTRRRQSCRSGRSLSSRCRSHRIQHSPKVPHGMPHTNTAAWHTALESTADCPAESRDCSFALAAMFALPRATPFAQPCAHTCAQLWLSSVFSWFGAEWKDDTHRRHVLCRAG